MWHPSSCKFFFRIFQKYEFKHVALCNIYYWTNAEYFHRNLNTSILLIEISSEPTPFLDWERSILKCSGILLGLQDTSAFKQNNGWSKLFFLLIIALFYLIFSIFITDLFIYDLFIYLFYIIYVIFDMK